MTNDWIQWTKQAGRVGEWGSIVRKRQVARISAHINQIGRFIRATLNCAMLSLAITSCEYVITGIDVGYHIEALRSTIKPKVYCQTAIPEHLIIYNEKCIVTR